MSCSVVLTVSTHSSRASACTFGEAHLPALAQEGAEMPSLQDLNHRAVSRHLIWGYNNSEAGGVQKRWSPKLAYICHEWTRSFISFYFLFCLHPGLMKMRTGSSRRSIRKCCICCLVFPLPISSTEAPLRVSVFQERCISPPGGNSFEWIRDILLGKAHLLD